MGQQKIQPIIDTVSVEGFEQIYQQELKQVQADPGPAQDDPTSQVQTAPDQKVQLDPTQGIPLEDAAKLLGLHVDTVRKRLQKGKIKGFKVADKFGEKWLVLKVELERPRPIQGCPTLQVQADPDQIQIDPIHDAEVVMDQAHDDPAHQAQADPSLNHALDRLLSSLEKKDVVIEGQAHQLKAAGDVIMYLRSQIEDRDSQLKLLTDSQHKTGWWAGFCSWFKAGN